MVNPQQFCAVFESPCAFACILFCVYTPTVRCLWFQVAQVPKSECKSNLFPLLPKLGSGTLSIATNYFHGRKQLKEFIFIFSSVFQIIVYMFSVYLPCSSIHDFDGDNQVYIKSTCVDRDNSGHTGVTW